MNYNHHIFGKIAWSLAPLVWGAFTWFMAWGWGSYFIPVSSWNYLIRVIAAFAIIIFFFRKSLNRALRDRVYCFGYPIALPPWWTFIGLLFFAVSMSFIPSLFSYELTQSLVLGICISSIIEEFITRSFFIKYKMGVEQFIVLNIISSLAFTFMHAFYVKDGVNYIQLLANGHFIFSFILGLIVYKTGRIELTILLHMFSNLVRYTIPVVLCSAPWPSLIAIIGNMILEVIFFLCLAGCSKQVFSKHIRI